MSTYPTYQAAKIANPDSEIYSLKGKFSSGDSPARPGEKWELCNPADYCMTNNKFINDGYNFEGGDIILNRCGEVVYMNHWTLAEYGVLNSSSHKTYVLRAKALEETNTIPTETPEGKEALDKKTYRYEKVTDSIFDLKEEFERGYLFVQILGNSGEYRSIEEETTLIDEIRDDNVYRRIEVTERELFIETYAWAVQDDISNIEDVAGMLFDSGKFKLVNGKG